MDQGIRTAYRAALQRRLEIDQVIVDAFRLFTRRPRWLFGLLVLAMTPYLLAWPFAEDQQGAAAVVATAIAVVLCGAIYVIATVWGAEVARGGSLRLNEATGRGLRRLVPGALAGLLGGVMITAAMALVLGPVGALVYAGAQQGHEGEAIGLMIASLPFVFAGALWLYSMFALAVPAAVLEDRGPVAALRRSARLTKGNRLRIAAIYFMASLVHIVIGFLGLWLVSIVMAVLAVLMPTMGLLLAGFAMVVPVAATVFHAAVFASTFVHLRRLAEGSPDDRLEQVFA